MYSKYDQTRVPAAVSAYCSFQRGDDGRAEEGQRCSYGRRISIAIQEKMTPSGNQLCRAAVGDVTGGL